MIGISIVAGIVGISGAFVDKKRGAVLMIIGAVIALVVGVPFLFSYIFSALIGILPFILLLIGGLIALKEKNFSS